MKGLEPLSGLTVAARGLPAVCLLLKGPRATLQSFVWLTLRATGELRVSNWLSLRSAVLCLGKYCIRFGNSSRGPKGGAGMSQGSPGLLGP